MLYRYNIKITRKKEEVNNRPYGDVSLWREGEDKLIRPHVTRFCLWIKKGKQSKDLSSNQGIAGDFHWFLNTWDIHICINYTQLDDGNKRNKCICKKVETGHIWRYPTEDSGKTVLGSSKLSTERKVYCSTNR